MARNILIKMDTLGAGQVAATLAQVWTSTTATGTFTQAGADIDITVLTPDGDGYITLASDADATDFVKIAVLESAGETAHFSPKLLGPTPTTPSLVTVEVYSKDVQLGVIQGLRFTGKPINGVVGSGSDTLLQQDYGTTDASGYAALTVPADTGVHEFTIANFTAEIDTTDLGGTAVNFADYV